ncbi:MAG: hypothetical protein E6Q97_12430 [Desulfurellales bacterium]|nr:MAG: hypothetical protein E6Q97_12430 [Desulfurellales bacterium]
MWCVYTMGFDTRGGRAAVFKTAPKRWEIYHGRFGGGSHFNLSRMLSVRGYPLMEARVTVVYARG